MKIITVTLSPAYDIHCFADLLCEGRENTVTMTSYDSGGKGVNLSRALAAMGKRSVAAVVLGEDNSEAFIKSMSEPAIEYSIIKIPGRIRENITVHTAAGEETRISFSAEPYREGTIEKIENIISESIGENTAVVFAGKLPDGIRERGLCKMLLGFKAKGAKLVLDSRSLRASDIAEVKPYLIKPNAEELALLTGTAVENFNDAKAAALSLCKLGAENVLVSMGKDGAALFGKLGEYFVAAPKISALSTVGAGDSLLAGFLYSASEGFCNLDCLRYAVAAGSAACLKEGTAPPDAEMIEKILNSMK